MDLIFKYTSLQSSFSVNNIALVNGRPKLLNLREVIKYFVEHRHDVVVRRTKFNLKKALKKFVCNSHYHSNLEVSKYENIFIIGSSSINNTFSANPTGIILEKLKEISKKI